MTTTVNAETTLAGNQPISHRLTISTAGDLLASTAVGDISAFTLRIAPDDAASVAADLRRAADVFDPPPSRPTIEQAALKAFGGHGDTDRS